MSSWKDIVATVAPTIASALGTPLAGLAVGAIGEVFGLSQATQEQVAQAVSGAKPADLFKLKEAEYVFAQKMRELEVDMMKISAEDRNSARQREVDIRDRLPAFLAMLVTAGFFGVLYFMAIQEVPKESKDALNIMLGSLGTAWIQVISYYFGSSSGSAAKTQLLGDKIK